MQHSRTTRKNFAYRLAIIQGIFYLMTGLWPLVHMPSFLAVTGPKTDLWLVNTVGLMIAATGAILVLAYRNLELNRTIIMLAVSNAAALTGIDIYYNVKNVIPPVYLLDAVAEVVLILLWFIALKKFRRANLNL